MTFKTRYGFFKNKHVTGTNNFVPLTISVTENLTDPGGANSSQPGVQSVVYTIDTNRPNATLAYNMTGTAIASDFTDNSLSANIVLDANGNATVTKTIVSNVSLGNVSFDLDVIKGPGGDIIYSGNTYHVYDVTGPTATGGTKTTNGNNTIHTFTTGTSRAGLEPFAITDTFAYAAASGSNPVAGNADVILANVFVPYGEQVTFTGVTDPNWTFLNGNTYVLRWAGNFDTPPSQAANLYDSSNTNPIRQAVANGGSGGIGSFNVGITPFETLTFTDKGNIGSNVFVNVFGTDSSNIDVLTVGAGGPMIYMDTNDFAPSGANSAIGGGGGGEVKTSLIPFANISANTAYSQSVGWDSVGAVLANAASTYSAVVLGKLTAQTISFLGTADEVTAFTGGVGGKLTGAGPIFSGGSGGASGYNPIGPSITYSGGQYFVKNTLGNYTYNGGGGAGYGEGSSQNPNKLTAQATRGGNGGEGTINNISGSDQVYGSGGGGGAGVAGASNGIGGTNYGIEGYGGGAGPGQTVAGNGTVVVSYVSTTPFRFISNTSIT